jgi:hypothetical protein
LLFADIPAGHNDGKAKRKAFALGLSGLSFVELRDSIIGEWLAT